jgi:tight adherence protein C
MILSSVCLFSITFLISFWLVSRSQNSADLVIERVLEKRRRVTAPGDGLLRWRSLLARIGNADRGKEQARLRNLFIRAGIRSQGAESIFRGLKVLAAVLGGTAAVLLLVLWETEGSRVVIGALAGIGGGYVLPDKLLRLRIGTRRKRIERALPNTLDLLTICVEAGLGLDQAIVQVAKELAPAYPEISDELGMISLEMRAGKRRADCLRGFGERTGIADVKKLAAVLIQADRFGTSIAQSLRIHSEHLRTERRQQAEEKAAKLGVKLVFPIFFFILPSLFVVTVGPVMVHIFKDLLPLMNSM